MKNSSGSYGEKKIKSINFFSNKKLSHLLTREDKLKWLELFLCSCNFSFGY